MKKTNQNQSEPELNSAANKLAAIKMQWQKTADANEAEAPAPAPATEVQLEQSMHTNHTNHNPSLAQQVVTQQHMTEQHMAQPMQANQSWKQKIRQIPLLGYLVASAKALSKLPEMRHQIALNADVIKAQNIMLQQQQQELAKLREENTLADDAMSKDINHLTYTLERYDALDIGKRLMQFDQMQLERHNKSIQLMMQLHNERENSLYVRIKQLEKAFNTHQDVSPVSMHFSTSESKDVAALENLEKNSLKNDAFYAEFEAIFRGSRADIKERLTIYLPYIENIPLDHNNNKRLVIDIGCGRGEWLELLHESGIQAMGVDLNAKMVDICIEQGLYARCADAIEVLREQAPGSVGAITGFHIIEHLPFELLIAMFDAALQALCVGGVIIFETPNPENLKVGACNFYFDPTHLNPIVPQVAEFMAKQRGFAHAEILRIHPYPEDHLLKGDSAVEKLINKELFGPQDYAVIGRK